MSSAAKIKRDPGLDAQDDMKRDPTRRITLVVRNQDDYTLVVHVKGSTKFAKVWDAYCNSQHVDPKHVRFLTSDGTRIQRDNLIDDFNVEPEYDDEGVETVQVEAFMEQLGGC